MLSTSCAKSRCVIFFLVALLATSATTANAQQVTRYEFLTVGEKSGEQVVTHGTDGSLTIHFQFNDRGQGPVNVLDGGLAAGARVLTL